MLVEQVTVSSPLNSYPTLQLRNRTVPEETGNCLSVFMLVQVTFRPVQSEILKLNKNCDRLLELIRYCRQSLISRPLPLQMNRNT